MKVLICGDTHGNMSHMITLMDNAVNQGCDRIVQLGDFGAWEHTGDGRQFMDDVNRHARKRNLYVYWIDGNHDNISKVYELHKNDQDAEGFIICRPRVLYIPRGKFWTWQGYRFFALGGAYSIDKQWRLEMEWARTQRTGQNSSGTIWFPEEEMTDVDLDGYLAGALVFSNGVDVILSHDKPRSSSPRWNRKDIQECWPNQDRIERAVQRLHPAMLFHGHLHFRYGDLIRHDGGWTEVFGLDSDPSSAHSKKAENSWMVLDLTKSAVERREKIDTDFYCDVCGGRDSEPGSIFVRKKGTTLEREIECYDHEPIAH